MITRKLLKVSGFFFFLFIAGFVKSQVPCNPIVLNEYCVANVGGYPDVFGNHTDWVELYNNHTQEINLSGYYLSNDPNNLKKWKFPAGTLIGIGSYKLIWMTGKDIVKSGEIHTNFTIEQCKKQTLLLSSPTGVIMDKVTINPSRAGQSWGRIDPCVTDPTAWRLYNPNAVSPLAPNGSINYLGIAPTPKLYVSTEKDFAKEPNPGGFYQGTQILYFKLEGNTYDTATSCYDIFYTLNGDYPTVGYPPVAPSVRYYDSINSAVTIDKTTMVRFIAVPRKSPACPPTDQVQQSFCGTNTYFLDPSHQLFDEDFGVVSVAIDQADQGWFSSPGIPAPATIHVEYYDKKQQMTEGYGVMEKPVNEAWKTEQKGFQVTIDDRLGSGCNFEGNIFNVEGLGTTSRTVFPSLHMKAGDYESHSQEEPAGTKTHGTGIRDVFVQSLAAKANLNVNPLHIKPVIGFINGEYAGVYDLREVYDKYYENYYHGQPVDSVQLNFIHGAGQEGQIKYWDQTVSKTGVSFRSEVYDLVIGTPNASFPMNVKSNYDRLLNVLDKESFIDYMILNSFFMNTDKWLYNVGFARGSDESKPTGSKWHYYLWNMPSALHFTTMSNTGNPANISPCDIHRSITAVHKDAHDGHGNILALLMGTYPGRLTWGNKDFQLQYKNRYQDLLNGPLKCDNIKKHLEYVVKLFSKEMTCHEDPACEPLGDFHSAGVPEEKFDSLAFGDRLSSLKSQVDGRCYQLQEANSFRTPGCYSQTGAFNITVDVEPAGAGKVKLNTIVLPEYPWLGRYFQTTMSFKAIEENDEFAFHHWEFENLIPNDPLSLDSIGVNFNTSGRAVAVFTDKKNGIVGSGEGANVPTGFTPNGDGINDNFRPLGSAEYATEYQMTIWNRWGQEVFRTAEPTNAWDGSYKGSQAQTGVYAYVITYRNIFNEYKTVKGNITLTR